MSVRRATRTAGMKKKEVFGQKKRQIRQTPTAPPSRPLLPVIDRTGMVAVSTRDAVALPVCELVMRADLSAVQLCLNPCFLLADSGHVVCENMSTSVKSVSRRHRATGVPRAVTGRFTYELNA